MEVSRPLTDRAVDSTRPSPPLAPLSTSPAATALAVDDLLHIEEVSTSEYYVGDLFRRQFGGEPPDYPRHFIAWYRAATNAYVVIGYLHCTIIDELYLVGGLVEDERAIGRMPAPHEVALRTTGGVAARLFRGLFERMRNASAYWAYVGDERIRSLFMAAGFETAGPPFMLVRWNDESMSASHRDAMVARVVALGPF
jgi:hypothetical protein